MKPSKARMALAGTVSAVVATAGLGNLTAASADVTTGSVDNLRTGWDQDEPHLGIADVTSSDFGEIFKTKVDGQVYAEPIIVDGVMIVITENNKAYGLDPQTGDILWTRSDIGPAWPAVTVNCGDLAPVIGITSAPVYDPATDSVYFTAKTYANNDPVNSVHFSMHSINPKTGAERPNWPVEMKGSPSNAPGTTFQPEAQGQRPGLLLMDGVVYAGFGSLCDMYPYRGYVMGVSTTGHAMSSMWTTESGNTDGGAGIWQGGGGLVSDGSGRIFVSTGNGVTGTATPGKTPPANLSESLVRLQVGADKSLSAADFFSPSNVANLDVNDTDLGSGGPVALPNAYFGTATHPHLLVEQGKDGRIFLLDRDNLGGSGQGAGGTDAALSILGPYAGQWGHPAVWGAGGYVYLVGNSAPMRAIRVGLAADGKTPQLVPAGQTADSFGYTSGSPVVTSDGDSPGSAVVWVVDAADPSSPASGVNAQLRAYNATPGPDGTLQLLYSAPIGTAAKFTTVATDGNRVYFGTRDGYVHAFGRPAASELTAAPVDFGQVTTKTGAATKTVAFTATTTVQVQSLAITSAAGGFAVAGPPNLTLPATLHAGDTVTIPVKFAPTIPGAATAILTAATDGGTVGVALNGTGMQDGLYSSPTNIAFETDQPTGTSANNAVHITNTGTKTETITAITPPAAPFTTGPLPAVGTAIAPGHSIDVAVYYSPTTANPNDSASLLITTTSGTLTVPFTGGSVVGVQSVRISPTDIDFGTVPVGTTVTRGFDVTNTGNVGVRVSKAKAPIGDFGSTMPIAEGTLIAVDQTVHVNATFTPSQSGPATAAYEITLEDGTGARYIQLSGDGAGAVPVQRLAGASRYETGVAVSQQHWANAGGDLTGREVAKTVVLARGDVAADALAGVPLAAYAQGPLLLTDSQALPATTLTEIQRVLGTSGTVDILGGTGAVSPAIETQLKGLGYTIHRFSGTDRYDTALQIAEHGLNTPAHVIVATGNGFADALSAGPLAAGPAATGGIPAAVVLSNDGQLPAAVADYVRARSTAASGSASAVYAVGGQAVTALASAHVAATKLAGADRYATNAAVVNWFRGAGPVTRIDVATGQDFPDALTGGALAATEGAVLVTVPKTLTPDISQMLNGMRTAVVAVEIFGGIGAISADEESAIAAAVEGRLG